MKTLIIITNITIASGSEAYIVPAIHALNKTLVEYDLRSLLTVRGKLTGNLETFDIVDSQLPVDSHKEFHINCSYADYLINQKLDGNNVVAEIKHIYYIPKLAIIMDRNDYFEEYAEKYEYDEQKIVRNLLLEYGQFDIAYHIE